MKSALITGASSGVANALAQAGARAAVAAAIAFFGSVRPAVKAG